MPSERSPVVEVPHSSRRPRRATAETILQRIALGVNKQSVLGALAFALGVAAGATPDSRVLGISLVVAGAFLLADPVQEIRQSW